MTSGYEDTIAAISTALSPAGIAVIRVSGPEAIQAVDRIFVTPSGKNLCSQPANTIHYGTIHMPETDGTQHERSGQEQIIDEVLVMLMRAPHSFTREDVVEIDCHGGVLSARRVLEAVLMAGARPAEPGEFTKRAFLNGRIDLSQAEAVMDIISSKNEDALRSSVKQLSGALSDQIREIRGTLLHETAFIEAALDDPEHIFMEDHLEELQTIVLDQKEKIERLIASSESGLLMKEGIKTVILGRPNAGKSSLLNALTGEETAIVTEIAGTTRDVLEEQVNLGNVTLRLLDTAGIRKSGDQIEQIGIARARAHAEDADLILYVVDSSNPLDENDHEILQMIREKRSIVLLNKTDLDQKTGTADLQALTSAPVLEISARSQTGLDALEDEIRRLFFGGKLRTNDEVVITHFRHRRALEEAGKSLDLVLNSLQDGMPEDFLSIDLMDACGALGQIIGADVSEDLINEIFSGFCLGK